jgi:hypothetical protein
MRDGRMVTMLPVSCPVCGNGAHLAVDVIDHGGPGATRLQPPPILSVFRCTNDCTLSPVQLQELYRELQTEIP